jgi:hypothetical protein
MNGLGRSLILLGLILAAIGIAVSIAPRFPWLGRLPGDIQIKRENFSFYFPMATCILISALISFIAWLFRR